MQKVWSGKVQFLENSPSPQKKNIGFDIVLVCPIRTGCKILLLKIPHTLVTGHRETKMALS